LISSDVLVSTPIAALVASAPVALRLMNDRIGLFEAWFAVAGLLCPLIALTVVAVRVARRALATLAPSASVSLLAVAASWCLLALPMTAVVGATLKANTHHRGLAGATYAALVLLICLASALVAWRATALTFSRLHKPALRTAIALGLGGAALVLLLAAVAGGALAVPSSEAGVNVRIPSLLVDGAVAFVVAAAVSLVDLRVKRSWWLGAAALALVSSGGLMLVARSPSLARSIADEAPLAGAVSGALGLTGDR